MFADRGRRPGARAAGAPCGPFQPFGGECRPQPHARLGPFDLGNGAQTYQVLQRAEEVGQVGVHAVHVAEVRVRMHGGWVDKRVNGFIIVSCLSFYKIYRSITWTYFLHYLLLDQFL